MKAIAINLPQFHPFLENDEWWGKGFTEWTNVTKAKPLFEGHYQPHLPADLGFYDLRLEEARVAQAELAKQYGIHGFCYYHYWFNGKRLMNKPLDDMLKTQTPDFPFMLCWANENWTRRWDGRDEEVLMKQTYGELDDKAHMEFLCENFFSDKRYITVDNKPFYLIYRPLLFPNIKRTLNTWREVAKQHGFDGLYLGYIQSFSLREDPENLGFDCAVEFQPDFDNLPDKINGSVLEKLKKVLRLGKTPFQDNSIFSYKEFVKKQIKKQQIRENFFPSITPMWDNSARRQSNAYILNGSTPDLYKKWLQHLVNQYKIKEEKHEKFIFINAWNEWAEGNHLEPCLKWKLKYLEATKQALES